MAEDRKSIVEAVKTQFLKDPQAEYTARQLADAQGIDTTPISAALHWLISKKQLLRRQIDDPVNEGRVCYTYRLPKRAASDAAEGKAPRRRKRQRSSFRANGTGPQPLIVLQYGVNESITVTMDGARALWNQLKAFHQYFR